MKLLNDFFEILCTEETLGKRRIKVRMNGSHAIYKVHFPNNPVTPGVCLVQMAMELLQAASGKQLQLTSIPKIKYRNVVNPGDEPWFEFGDVVAAEEQYHVQVTICSDGRNYAQMKLHYKACDEQPS